MDAQKQGPKLPFQWRCKTLQQLTMWDFFRTLMAKRWSDPSDDFFSTRITFPNPPSTKILIGWKLPMETSGWAVLPLVSAWPETQSFNVLLRHRILYRIIDVAIIIQLYDVFVVVFMLMMMMMMTKLTMTTSISVKI